MDGASDTLPLHPRRRFPIIYVVAAAVVFLLWAAKVQVNRIDDRWSAACDARRAQLKLRDSERRAAVASFARKGGLSIENWLAAFSGSVVVSRATVPSARGGVVDIVRVRTPRLGKTEWVTDVRPSATLPLDVKWVDDDPPPPKRPSIVFVGWFGQVCVGTVAVMAWAVLSLLAAAERRVRRSAGTGAIVAAFVTFLTLLLTTNDVRYWVSAGGFHWLMWPLGMAAAAAIVTLWDRFRVELPLNHCGECGYDLTGNTSGVCPECGARIARRLTAAA